MESQIMTTQFSQDHHVTGSNYGDKRNWFIYEFVEDTNPKKSIMIAGSVTRQQHKLALCMIGKVFAEFTTAEGNNSWVNFRQKFAQYKTEGKVEEGLRTHGFVLERIVPDHTGTPVLQFRVRNRAHLYRLAGKVADNSLAGLLTDYLIPPEEKQTSDVITLRFDQRQFAELEEKIKETDRQSMEMYEKYKAMRSVDSEGKDRESPEAEQAYDNNENEAWRQFRNKVMNTGLDVNRQRCVLQNVENFH